MREPLAVLSGKTNMIKVLIILIITIRIIIIIVVVVVKILIIHNNSNNTSNHNDKNKNSNKIVLAIGPPPSYQPPLLNTVYKHIHVTRYLQYFRDVVVQYQPPLLSTVAACGVGGMMTYILRAHPF